jgi:hypothetical protein
MFRFPTTIIKELLMCFAKVISINNQLKYVVYFSKAHIVSSLMMAAKNGNM